MDLTVADWIALGTVVLPLVAKLADDWAANKAQKHNLALDRIVGMAGREAGSIARALDKLPPGVDAATTERALIQTSVASIAAEMTASVVTTKAGPDQLQSIVRGELDKVIASRTPVIVPVITPTIITALKGATA